MPPIRLFHHVPRLAKHENAFHIIFPHSIPKAAFLSDASYLAGSLNGRATVHTYTHNSSKNFTTEPNVDIKSLRNTLEAHREVNRPTSPKIWKFSETGEPVLVQDPDRGLPGIEIKIPEKKTSFKRIPLDAVRAFRGSYHDLDALWGLKDSGETLPLQHRLPWLHHLDDGASSPHLSALERLSAEIRAFERYSAPSEEEQRAATEVLQDIIRCVEEVRGDLDVEVIGSRATGLADPLSDLDINISDPKESDVLDTPAQRAPHLMLRSLHQAFRKASQARNEPVTWPIQSKIFIHSAQVPILICSHGASGLPIQIQSTPRTYDSREYVKASLREYSSLKSLFKVLKQCFQMRSLTVGSAGGLTSYPLLQMIVAALRFSEGKFHPNDVANQLLFFLDFYSDIDFSAHGISTDPLDLFPKSVGRRLDRHDKSDNTKHRTKEHDSGRSPESRSIFRDRSQRKIRGEDEYLMTLQDPTNPVNDLGRRCHRIQDVQETIITLRSNLKRVMDAWDSSSRIPNPPGQRSRVQSLLEPLVGGDYRIYEHEREDLRRFGRGLLADVENAGAPESALSTM